MRTRIDVRALCYTQSLTSLSEGRQSALWELGGVPLLLRSDRMTAAFNNLVDQADFQKSQTQLRHYADDGRTVETRLPNENGNLEQRDCHFRCALEQALMLRGSRAFAGLDEHRTYLGKLTEQLNSAVRRGEEEIE